MYVAIWHAYSPTERERERERWLIICDVRVRACAVGNGLAFFGSSGSKPDLPPPNIMNLPAIHTLITQPTNHYQKERLARAILDDQTYLDKLVRMIDICESLEDPMQLRHISEIFRGLST